MRKRGGPGHSVVEPFLPVEKGMTVDVRLGRWLAFCVYPCAAWRRLPSRGRAVLIAAYFAIGYAIVLMLLFAL
jgi:hypothetical protein